MKTQQQVWLLEHEKADALPALAHSKPASGVVYFSNWLCQHGIKPPLSVIDIGCGKGRNSCFLAEQGYHVYGIDYIPLAIDVATRLVVQRNVQNNVTFNIGSIDAPWPYPSNFFDIAIDSFSSIDIETFEGRVAYCNEMLRTLKPGGYAFITVVSTEDEWEKQLIAQSPGAEPNSTIWPQNNKFQKNYTQEELRIFYKDFRVIELKEVQKDAFKLGKPYKATNFWAILQKVDDSAK